MKLRTTVLLTLAVLAPGAAAQEPIPGGNLARAADGEPVCGLGRSFHGARRALLRERAGKGVMVFRGLPDTRDYLSFRQSKVFWYLTGVETPNAALAMDCESGREVLFVNKPSAWKERWEGEIWDADDRWVKEITGIAEVRPIGDLLDVLDEMMGDDGERTLWTSLSSHVELAGCIDRAGPYDRRRQKDPLDGRTSREEKLAEHLGERYGVEVESCTGILNEMRRVKTPEEVAALGRASRAGAVAMQEAMRSTRPDLGEWELGGLIAWMQQRNGADGVAYAAIVGSGPNSLVLHYNFSTRTMRDGEMVLIDFGPEVDHYIADITRTWPVNGKFTDEQAEIYDAVLEAQRAGIAAVKPGKTMSDIEAVCAKVLKDKGFEKLMAHGACHYVGMEVHGVGSGRAPFEPGVAFVIEPGLYDAKTNIGVRIEDVIVVTEDGCEVISRHVPKERAEIEAIMAERGVLDWVDGDAK